VVGLQPNRHHRSELELVTTSNSVVKSAVIQIAHILIPNGENGSVI
jgi:hypothetical protein